MHFSVINNVWKMMNVAEGLCLIVSDQVFSSAADIVSIA